VNKKTWLGKCANRFIDKAKLDIGEAAAAADACADLEELTNGSEMDHWLSPERAADEEMDMWNAEAQGERA